MSGGPANKKAHTGRAQTDRETESQTEIERLRDGQRERQRERETDRRYYEPFGCKVTESEQTPICKSLQELFQHAVRPYSKP